MLSKASRPSCGKNNDMVNDAAECGLAMRGHRQCFAGHLELHSSEKKFMEYPGGGGGVDGYVSA